MSPFLKSPAISSAAAEPQSPYRTMPYRGGIEAPSSSSGPIRTTVGGSANKPAGYVGVPQYGGGNWTPPRPTANTMSSSLEMGGRGPLAQSSGNSQNYG